MKNNKYCCEWFYAYHNEPNANLNIRIVKSNSISLRPLFVNYANFDTGKPQLIKNSNVDFRFFLMMPYNTYDFLLPGILLSYCPFCGENLYTFYGKNRNINDYINEIEGVTFNI